MNDEYIKSLETKIQEFEDLTAKLSNKLVLYKKLSRNFLVRETKIFGICFTGPLKTMTREEAIKLIDKKKKVTYTPQVGWNTDFLVTNNQYKDTKKLQKVDQAKVDIITEEEFLELLDILN